MCVGVVVEGIDESIVSIWQSMIFNNNNNYYRTSMREARRMSRKLSIKVDLIVTN